MIVDKFLSTLFLIGLANCFYFQNLYNNGIGQMREVEAYDDLRLVRLSNMRQSEQVDFDLDELFTNLTKNDGQKYVQRLLSAKEDSRQAVVDAENYARVIIKATEKLIANNYKKLSYENYRVPSQYCQSPYMTNPCDPNYPYRSLDGSCNNLNYPWWGAANTPYKRLLEPDYDDGVNAMKEKSVVKNYFLPNSRLVAITLHRENPTKSIWSNFMVSFGQSMAHELALTYATRNADGTDLECDCRTQHENCYSIAIPEGDSFYNNKKQCYPFTRDQASVRDYDCSYGPREQINRYSHFLDLSYLYSNSYHRKRIGGQLRFSVNANGEITFPLKNPNGCPYARGEIYHMGDLNGEQNVYLTGTQTMWLRNHNQLAETLQKINPHWDDETLFQQARRLNTAMYQHIVYNEYLPNLLGPTTLRVYDIEPLTWGYYTKYNPKLYPQLLNEFSAAAFRLHFLVNHQQCWADEKFRLFGCHDLADGMRNSSHSCWSVDEIIRGQVAQSSYYSTPQLSFVMNNLLLHKPNSIGVLNIQRGRDHGLKGYNFYRELCGLNRARSFEELYNIPLSARNQLKSLYYHVDDIDLWSGGAAELPVKDGFIGHTFSCIIAKQFQDLKRGDRFYYEHGHSDATRFTPEQLNVIRSTSLAAIVCRTVETKFVPKWPFLIWDKASNPFTNCKDIAYVSLNAWKEAKSY